METISALSPSDKVSLQRLGHNWSEQLALEEAFLSAVYHHLQYTLQVGAVQRIAAVVSRAA